MTSIKSRTMIRMHSSFPIGRCWPVIGCHNGPTMSLVTHVSSNHRCWYFHQPRPLMAKPGSHSSHWAQHSLDREKNKELFLAHFHVLHKSSDTKMREKIMPNFLPRAYFPVTCALVPGSHTDTGRVRVSLVSCPALLPTARENWS